MDKELISYTKKGHKVLLNGVSFRLISIPDNGGKAHAVLDKNWEFWEKVNGNLRYGITPTDEELNAYRKADTVIDLNAAEPLEKVRFMYRGEKMEFTTGDSIMLNGDVSRLFFIDMSHIEMSSNGYSFAYHLSEFVDSLKEFNAEVDYVPRQAA